MMHTPTFERKNLIILESGLSFVLLLIGIISYLRSIGYMVSEKESRNIENL